MRARNLRRTVFLVAGLLVTACATVDEESVRRAETHGQLAGLKMQKGELEIAIREYLAGLRFNPDDPELHFGISEAYRRKGFFDDAEDHLLKTLSLSPKNTEARLNLGTVYLQQERWDEAIPLNTALIEDPTFLRPERALVNRGWAHYKSGLLDEAAEDFRQAVSHDGTFSQAHLNLGIVLYEKGEIVESVKAFNAALSSLERRSSLASRPMQAQTRFRLAQAYVKLGRRGVAVDQLRQATEIGESNEWGRKSKEYLAVLE